ncbi:hypothetical protein HELRODRAFT_113133 [Helobdella robusta]|uniref:Translation initiation factor eIF2B subunit epsilon n=1 Tax=Helobdella robusta TaxID=6412 RepID=T1EFQ5_HELRO|nr:hypothetical protein HELRODRAFT_113133 [Helobdella robusta]ESO00591.1 hypothetical protein HELRODRAFT_113133 [Helobdella robusta]
MLNKSDFKEEDKIQAIVIADSFDSKFNPLTMKRPNCLLPLANVPFLDYVLETLHSSGVHETFIFTSNHVNLVKEHVKNSKWGNECCRMKVGVVVSDNCYSLGEALREIDKKALIRDDFVLIQGSVVSNVNLQAAINEHKRRKIEIKDRMAIMTMLMMHHSPDDPLRNPDNDVCLTVDKCNNRILNYQKTGKSKKFSLPIEVLEKPINNIQFDLLPCQINICSPVVLTQMTDNFDFQTVDALVCGLLSNEDIYGFSIHFHELLRTEYAVHVDCLSSYKKVSNQVVKRFSYPLVIDNNFTGRKFNKYRCNDRNVYSHVQCTNFDLDDLTGMHDVVLGRGVQVGDGSTISNSVLGRNCIIGRNVKIEDSIIFDNVVIEDNCTVTGSVIDQTCIIHKNCQIPKNCILGRGVTVYENDNLLEDYKLVSDNTNNFQHVSPGNKKCFILPLRTVSESLDLLDGSLSKNDEEKNLEDDYNSDDDDDDDVNDVPIEFNESKIFYDEVISNLERTLSENISSKNVILEINSVKHAYGIQIRELTILLTKAFLDMSLRSEPPPNNFPSFYALFKTHMTTFLPILKNYVKTESSQGDMLIGMQEMAESVPLIMTALPKVVLFFFDEDILTEEGILKWWYGNENKSDELNDKLCKFIEWLEKDDDEDDEDDDDDDEDD